MDDVDLTPEPLVLEPGEQRVADAVRAALSAPVPGPGLLAAVRRRATRRHRRRVAGGAAGGALALAGLVALVPLELPLTAQRVPRGPATPSVTPSSGEQGGPSLPEAMLTDEEVATVAPGATWNSSEGGPGGDLLAGLCGTTVLEGDPPTAYGRATWSQEPAAPDLAASVDERVTRWPSVEGATAHAEVTAASPTQCGDLDGGPSDQATHLPLAAQQDDGPPRTLAAAAVEGSESGWVVRATDVAPDGVTVVDLTVTIEAETSAAAGSAVEGLLELALVRAVEEVAVPVPTSPPRRLDQDPLLTPDLVGFFIPDAAVVAEPAPANISQDTSGAPVGGLCGDAALTGVPAPTGAWAGAWEQGGPGAGDRDTISLRETVLRWDGATPEATASYVEATRGSVTECGDPQAPEKRVSYRLLPEQVQEGHVEVVAVAPVPDSATTWGVRIVGTGPGPDGRRDTVVDLDLVILAATAEDAAWIADGVLQISLAQATTDTSRLVGPEGAP